MSELISFSKSSPRLSEVPLTQMPLSTKFFHVFKPLVQITLFELILESSGIELIREIFVRVHWHRYVIVRCFKVIFA